MFLVSRPVVSLAGVDPRSSSFSPVFVVSNVLLVSSPPALTLAQVRQPAVFPVDHCNLLGSRSPKLHRETPLSALSARLSSGLIVY